MNTTNTKRAGLAATLIATAAMLGGLALSPAASATTKQEAQESFDACVATYMEPDLDGYTWSDAVTQCCGNNGIVLETDAGEAYDCIPMWDSVEESNPQPTTTKPGLPGKLPTVPNAGRR